MKHYPGDVLPKDEIPHEHAVRQAHLTALHKGASKHTNVFVYGPKNAGKSFSLDGLAAVCKDFAFLRPAGKAKVFIGESHRKEVLHIAGCSTQQLETGVGQLAGVVGRRCI